MSLNQLNIPQLLKLSLLIPHNLQFFLLQDLHLTLLKSSHTHHIQHRFHFFVEIECRVLGFHLSGGVLPDFLGFEERGGRTIYIEVTLDSHLKFWWLICQVLHKGVSLSFEIDSTLNRFWSFDVPSINLILHPFGLLNLKVK